MAVSTGKKGMDAKNLESTYEKYFKVLERRGTASKGGCGFEIYSAYKPTKFSYGATVEK